MLTGCWFSLKLTRGVSQEFDHFPTTGRFSGCCFRLNGIFDRELSRSLVDKWLLVTTPFASDPPNQTPNYLTVGNNEHPLMYLIKAKP